MPVSVRANQPSLDLDFLLQRYGMNLQPKAFSDLITFNRASAATRVNALGLIESVAANVPRVDHSPVNLTTGTGTQTVALEMDNTYAVTAVGGTVVVAGSGVGVGQMGAASGVITTPPGAGTVDVTFTTSGGLTALHVREVRGLLIEEQRTNYFANSEGQTYSAGSSNNGLSFEKVGDGYIGNCKFTDIRVSGVSTTTYLDVLLSFRDGGIPAGDIACSVIYGVVAAPLPMPSYRAIKIVDYASDWSAHQVVDSNVIDLNAGDPVARRTVLKSARADRVVVNFVLSMSASIGQSYDFTVRLGMPQLESGAFSTSYIPTSGSQVTRAADVASINALSPWWNAQEGSLISESITPYSVPPDNYPFVVNASGATGNDIKIGGFATVSALEVSAGGSSQVGLYPPYSGLSRKIGVAFKQDSFAVCVNGGAVLSDLAGLVPTVTKMAIGENLFNGHIRKLRYFPKRLSDAQLQALTA